MLLTADDLASLCAGSDEGAAGPVGDDSHAGCREDGAAGDGGDVQAAVGRRLVPDSAELGGQQGCTLPVLVVPQIEGKHVHAEADGKLPGMKRT